jgi:heme/copper-type cytochrome/quinol oxidase subunit 4
LIYGSLISAHPTIIDTRLHFYLILGMNDRLGTAVELVAFAAFIAAIFIVVMGSLTFISSQCSHGTPILPAIFPCFQ